MSDQLTQSRLKELLRYDPDTGLFHWIANRAIKNCAGKLAGWAERSGYIRITVDQKSYLAHRLVWLYVHGQWPAEEMDHIDTMRNNNRISNLRQVSRESNMHNQRRAHSQSKSGFLGVSPHKNGKWKAQLRVGKKDHYLGLFTTPELAHAAYLEAKSRLHPTQPV